MIEMGKDAKAGGGKGKGKQSGGSDEASSKGKGKAGKAAADGLGTCTYQGMCCAKSKERSTRRIKGCRLAGGWLSNGDKVPPAEFAKIYILKCVFNGWFPRGKMEGPFQDVAFNTPVGVTSAPFKS
ncbi:LOW QUALITY PROTEIN: hypothetical protein HID58_047274, partial [Brassica napus]